jgi:hypothetical protein
MSNIPTDEELRKLLKPNPSHDDVLRSIESSYGLSNVHIVHELESYDDRNYLIRHSESLFLVKIHNGVESAQFLRSNLHDTASDEYYAYLGSKDYSNVFLSRPKNERGVSSIDLQNAIFQTLSESRYNLKSSVPVKAISDHLEENPFVALHSFPVVSNVYSPCRLAMRLLLWVDGKPMSSCSPISIETMAQAGMYLGRLCHALDDLTRDNDLAVQAATRYHAWDGKNTLDLEKFTPYIKDPPRQSLVLSVIEAFREDLGFGESPSRCGILHGDFNDANIILNDQGIVDGVIDFGDSTYR